VLIDIVGIEQSAAKGREQALAIVSISASVASLGEAFERGVFVFFHLAKSLVAVSLTRELGVAEYGGLHVSDREFKWQ